MKPWRLRLPFSGDALSRFAVVALVVLLIVGLLGPRVGLGGDPTDSVGPRLQGPGGDWWFGTDSLGRSLLPRVVEGIGTTILLATFAVAIAAFIGTLLGIVAAYAGGFVDQLFARVADVFFSFPAILLAILASAVLGPGSSGAMVAMVLATLPLMLRVVRSATLNVAPRDFVVSSRVSGASFPRIVLVHLLPNVAGAAIVQATYALSVGMLVESGLSFLGLGVQAPDASLGSLLRDGNTYLTIAPWTVIFPGAALALAVLSVNLLGDGIRDALEPRAPRSLS